MSTTPFEPVDPDPFEHDDAAYVLGALDPDERAAFETHLATCAACARRVADLRPVAGLLDGITADDLLGEPEVTGPPLPDTLLPGLLRRAEVRRRRGRFVLTAVGGLAAAAIVALAIALGVGSGGTGSAPAAGRDLVAVRPTDLAVRANLIAKDWGTEIDLHCTYRDDNTTVFGLRIVDTAGRVHDGESWPVWTGTTNFIENSDVPLNKIARIEVVNAKGRPVMGVNV